MKYYNHTDNIRTNEILQPHIQYEDKWNISTTHTILGQMKYYNHTYNIKINELLQPHIQY